MEDEDYDSDSTVLLKDFIDKPEKINAKRRRLSNFTEIRSERYDNNEDSTAHSQIQKQQNAVNNRTVNDNVANSVRDVEIICLDTDDEEEHELGERAVSRNDNLNKAGVRGNCNNSTDNYRHRTIKVLTPATINSRRVTIHNPDYSAFVDNFDKGVKTSVITRRRGSTSFERTCSTNPNNQFLTQQFQSYEVKLPSEPKRVKFERKPNQQQKYNHNIAITPLILNYKLDKTKKDIENKNIVIENLQNTHSQEENKEPKTCSVGIKTVEMDQMLKSSRLQDKELRHDGKVDEQPREACALSGTGNEVKLPSVPKRVRFEKKSIQQKTDNHNNTIKSLILNDKLDKTEKDIENKNIDTENRQNTHSQEGNKESKTSAVEIKTVKMDQMLKSSRQDKQLRHDGQVDEQPREACALSGTNEVKLPSEPKRVRFEKKSIQQKTHDHNNTITSLILNDKLDKTEKDIENKNIDTENRQNTQSQEGNKEPKTSSVGIKTVEMDQMLKLSRLQDKQLRHDEKVDEQARKACALPETGNEKGDILDAQVTLKHKKVMNGECDNLHDKAQLCNVRNEEVMRESHQEENKQELKKTDIENIINESRVNQNETDVHDKQTVTETSNGHIINDSHDKQDTIIVRNNQEITSVHKQTINKQDQNIDLLPNDRGICKANDKQEMNESYVKRVSTTHDVRETSNNQSMGQNDDVRREHGMDKNSEVQEKENSKVINKQGTVKILGKQETKRMDNEQKTTEAINDLEGDTIKLKDHPGAGNCLKFHIKFFQIVKEYLRYIAYPESERVINNLIKKLQTQQRNGIVQIYIKYECPECKYVSTYSNILLNNTDVDKNIVEEDDLKKCRICKTLKKLHISYTKRHLYKIENPNKVPKQAESESHVCKEAPSQNINITKEKDNEPDAQPLTNSDVSVSNEKNGSSSLYSNIERNSVNNNKIVSNPNIETTSSKEIDSCKSLENTFTQLKHNANAELIENKAKGRNENIHSDDITINDSSKYKYHCTICNEIFSNEYIAGRHRKRTHPDFKNLKVMKKVIIKGKYDDHNKELEKKGVQNTSGGSDNDGEVVTDVKVGNRHHPTNAKQVQNNIQKNYVNDDNVMSNEDDDVPSDANDQENGGSDGCNDTNMPNKSKSSQYVYECTLCNGISFSSYSTAQNHRIVKHPTMNRAHIFKKKKYVATSNEVATSNDTSPNKKRRSQSSSHDDNDAIKPLSPLSLSIIKNKTPRNEKQVKARDATQINGNKSTQEATMDRNSNQLLTQQKGIEKIDRQNNRKYCDIPKNCGDASVKRSELTAKKTNQRLTELFGDDNEVSVQVNKKDCDPEVETYNARIAGNLITPVDETNPKDVNLSDKNAEREDMDGICRTEVNYPEHSKDSCINNNGKNCNEATEASELEINGENKMDTVIFKCVCGLCFVTLKILKEHFLNCEEHTNNGKDCPDCTVSRRFLPTELINHQSLHHGTIKYKFRVRRIAIQEETNNSGAGYNAPSKESGLSLNVNNELLKAKPLTQTCNEESNLRQPETIKHIADNTLTQNANENLTARREISKAESLTQIGNPQDNLKDREINKYIERNQNESPRQGAESESKELNEETAGEKQTLNCGSVSKINIDGNNQSRPESVEFSEANIVARNKSEDQTVEQGIVKYEIHPKVSGDEIMDGSESPIVIDSD